MINLLRFALGLYSPSHAFAGFPGGNLYEWAYWRMHLRFWSTR